MTSFPPPSDPAPEEQPRRGRPLSGWFRNGKPLGAKVWITIIGLVFSAAVTAVAAANSWFTSEIEMVEHTGDFDTHVEMAKGKFEKLEEMRTDQKQLMRDSRRDRELLIKLGERLRMRRSVLDKFKPSEEEESP
jgi:hypothetical protein